MPILELDLILNYAIIPTSSLLLHVFIINYSRKANLGKQENSDQEREKLSTVEKETRVEASSKKMLQVDIRVDKVKPVALISNSTQQARQKRKGPEALGSEVENSRAAERLNMKGNP